MKSTVSKHSVVVHGHKTSVSLEPAFWDVLVEAARMRDVTVSELVSQIDQARSYNNLSSALRLFALDFCRERSTRQRVAEGSPAA
jgi:predicted DNA-binding ribbon-helix-helix protein